MFTTVCSWAAAVAAAGGGIAVVVAVGNAVPVAGRGHQIVVLALAGDCVAVAVALVHNHLHAGLDSQCPVPHILSLEVLHTPCRAVHRSPCQVALHVQSLDEGVGAAVLAADVGVVLVRTALVGIRAAHIQDGWLHQEPGTLLAAFAVDRLPEQAQRLVRPWFGRFLALAHNHVDLAAVAAAAAGGTGRAVEGAAVGIPSTAPLELFVAMLSSVAAVQTDLTQTLTGGRYVGVAAPRLRTHRRHHREPAAC